MKNSELVFNYENEFYGYANLSSGKTTICVAKHHLDNLAFLILNNPVYTTKIDPGTAFGLFNNTIFDSDFYEGWMFEFKSAKKAFLFTESFNPATPIPDSLNGALEFWSSVYFNEHPIYYSSAIAASWGLEGWSKTAKKIASKWITNRQTPFFKFSTLDEAKIDHIDRPTQNHGYHKQFVVKGNYQNFEYLKRLPSVTPHFLEEFANAIQPKSLELCYN